MKLSNLLHCIQVKADPAEEMSAFYPTHGAK